MGEEGVLCPNVVCNTKEAGYMHICKRNIWCVSSSQEPRLYLALNRKSLKVFSREQYNSISLVAVMIDGIPGDCMERGRLITKLLQTFGER